MSVIAVDSDSELVVARGKRHAVGEVERIHRTSADVVLLFEIQPGDTFDGDDIGDANRLRNRPCQFNDGTGSITQRIFHGHLAWAQATGYTDFGEYGKPGGEAGRSQRYDSATHADKVCLAPIIHIRIIGDGQINYSLFGYVAHGLCHHHFRGLRLDGRNIGGQRLLDGHINAHFGIRIKQHDILGKNLGPIVSVFGDAGRLMVVEIEVHAFPHVLRVSANVPPAAENPGMSSDSAHHTPSSL